MMHLLYNLAIRLYGFSIRLASIWNSKAKKWHAGRKAQIHQDLSKFKGALWIHCASVGEFEQVKPIIDRLKSETDHKLVVSFFSPSGFELNKANSSLDYVFYLPLDTKRNMRSLILELKPSMLILAKYELWLNMIAELQKEKVPIVLVSALFQPNQIFFKPFGGIFRRALRALSMICVQDEESVRLLKSIRIEDCKVTGDSRFDRVLQLRDQSLALNIGTCNRKLIIAGSAWAKDEDLLFKVMQHAKSEFQLLLVPHELSREYKIPKGLSCGLYSEGKKFSEDLDVLVFDQMGYLSKLYRLGDLCYIGGGFGHGIHNILEPAVYAKPVLFGPNHHRFREAKGLIQNGGAKEIGSELAFEEFLKENAKSHQLKAMGELAFSYVDENKGAVDKCLDEINKLLS